MTLLIQPQDKDDGKVIEVLEEYEDEAWGQLPVVEDMEIAALAAEAAMEAVRLKDSRKMAAVRVRQATMHQHTCRS